jgi:hypothetical protein
MTANPRRAGAGGPVSIDGWEMMMRELTEDDIAAIEESMRRNRRAGGDENPRPHEKECAHCGYGLYAIHAPDRTPSGGPSGMLV